MELVTAQGRRYAVDVGVNSVGRSPENNIVLEDGSMSRRHAELHWDGQQCLVVDLGSTNGTFVDGGQVAPHQPQPVPPGARLRFGSTMTVTLVAGGPGGGPSRPSPRPAWAGSHPTRAGVAGGPGLEMLFRAVDVALDYRKLALGLLGLLAAGIAGAVTLWLVGQVAGESVALGAAIGLVGAIALWLILTMVAAAISRLAFLELAEGERGGIREALGYARQHLVSLLLSPLALLVGLVLILVAEAIFLLIGRINYVGEVVVSLAFLPLVLVNLAILVLALFGTVLTFPVIAEQGGGVRATIVQVWSMVRRVPGRLVAYMMLAGLISVVMFLFCLYLVTAALYITISLAVVGMEPFKFMLVFSGLPLNVGDLLPGLPLWGPGSLAGEAPATFVIARLLFGLSVAGLMALILVIPQLFFLSCACAVYLGLQQDLPEVGNPRPPLDETWAADGSDRGGRKGCRYCGASLAYDQIYCPNCGQMQR